MTESDNYLDGTSKRSIETISTATAPYRRKMNIYDMMD